MRFSSRPPMRKSANSSRLANPLQSIIFMLAEHPFASTSGVRMSKRQPLSVFAVLSVSLPALLLTGMVGAAQAAEEDGNEAVRYAPISITGQIDAGQIINGETGWHESGSL